MDIESRLQEAVQSYWDARAKNKGKQIDSGKIDAGSRGEVTGGTQMGALEVLVADILCEAGLDKVDVRTRTALELPGYFRATKKWDLIVVSEGHLVLAMEFKSQAGESIGNNLNNRSEEAVGSAKDIWIAFREGRFGKSPIPFLGYFFMLEVTQEFEYLSRTRNHISLSIQCFVARQNQVPNQTGCGMKGFHMLNDTSCFAGGLSWNDYILLLHSCSQQMLSRPKLSSQPRT